MIDPTGTVRWVNLTDNIRVRASGPQVLKVVDQLGVGARPENPRRAPRSP